MTIKYTTNQQKFIDLINEGKNIDLSGKAGTGKSFIVKEAIRLLKEKKKKVIAVAPTGIAANNIGGTTIHSTFNVSPFGVQNFDSANFLKSEKRRMLELVDVIFIDEKSMVRPDLLDAINWTLKKNGIKGGLQSKQVILIGDMKQLPTIVDDNSRSILYQQYEGDKYYNSDVYKRLEFEIVELNEIMRQSDGKFIEALNIVREGGKSEYFKQFLHTEPKGVILAPHNDTVKQYNDNGLIENPGKIVEFNATIEGNAKFDEFNIESKIIVKHGAKIMYLVNSKNNPLINGTLGTFIVNLIDGEDKYFIKVGNVEYALDFFAFKKMEYIYDRETDSLKLREIGGITQMPIRLAYALSIHKSQGLTFDEITVDLSKPCFVENQMYVALSRVKSPEGLRIIVNRK